MNTPRTFPQVVVKLKEAYGVWLLLHRDFPKIERLGIGNKIERVFLETLELMFCASYLSPQYKIPLLGKAIARLDVLKFFTQLAWEHKHIANHHYADLLSRLEEVGRQLGGWKKGLEQKTPRPYGQGERR